MNLELQIPEEIAHLLTSKYADLPRAAVEALALEGYRSKRLSEGQLRQMLGFSLRMQVHAFLKDHGVYFITPWMIWTRTGRCHATSKRGSPAVLAWHDRSCGFRMARQGCGNLIPIPTQ